MDEPLTDAVARGTRSAMQLIYSLRACGVERDISVPQIAVIGDQSSGKVRRFPSSNFTTCSNTTTHMPVKCA